MQTLGKRHCLRNAVNRRARSKDKALDSRQLGSLEQMERSADVGIVIKLRLPDRRPHPGPRRQMRDGLEFFPVKEQVYRTAVAQIDSMNGHVAGDRFHIGPLDLRVIKIVEIVEDRDFVSGGE
jgi:hypothetical protein